MTKFSDLILGFLLGVLALSLGRHALADQAQDRAVNVNIKEEYIRIDAAHRQQLEFNQISARRTEVGALPRQPVEFNNPIIDHEDSISSAEQNNEIMEDPRRGFVHTEDPNDSVERKIAEDQAYSLYREHYRGAMKRELIRRAQAVGYQPTDKEANDVTARAMLNQ